MQAAELFALPPSLQAFADSFRADAAPWDWVKQIGPALKAHAFPAGRPSVPAGVHVEGLVHLDPTVKLPPYATIIGPVWIGPRTEIRPGAFIRGNVIVGADGVLGNACEFKNCLLLDRVQVPHFSYVGDSVLGNGAHLGAGVICSNLRLDHAEVEVRLPAGHAKTGLRKLGALLGDEAEVGCNAVLQPGTILGRRALVLPLTSYSGTLAPAMMAGHRQAIVRVPRRD